MQIPATAAGPVQELREAIAAFSDVKPSLAWAETYPGTMSYYLASAFREVWMQPSGTVGLIGFATGALFFRDALEKAGIEAQFISRGEYKSAANRFTRTATPTPTARRTRSAAGQPAHQVWKAIAESRHIEPAAVDELADRAPLLRDDAVTGRLVDRIGFRDEAYARISELVGAPGISPETGDADSDPDAPPRLFLSRYAKATANTPGPQMLVDSRPQVQADNRRRHAARTDRQRPRRPARAAVRQLQRGGDTIAAALREAAADDSVIAHRVAR